MYILAVETTTNDTSEEDRDQRTRSSLKKLRRGRSKKL